MHGGGSRRSRCELELGLGETRDFVAEEEEGMAGGINRGGQNHPSEIVGLQNRDVPYSTDTITINDRGYVATVTRENLG